MIAPWQVWLVNFDPQVGSEQAGVRPAIVVGSPDACRIPRLALVVPCTTRLRGLSWHQPVQLDRPSEALCDHVKSVSLDRLIKRLPHQLTRAEVDGIRFRLRKLLAI